MGESILMGGGGGRIPQLSEQIETFYLTLGNLQFTLTWTHPAQDQDESFIGTRIVRKVGSCPQSPNDGTVIYEGTAFTYTDTGLTEGTTYYYRAFAYNAKKKYQNSMRYVYGTAVSGILISELPVGSLVNIKTNNSNVKYLVVHQGNPDNAAYDDSCNGTWLWMKDFVWYSQQFASVYHMDFSQSPTRTFLNGIFINQISANTRQQVMQVKIPYDTYSGSAHVVKSKGDGNLTTAFVLSPKELGDDVYDNYSGGSKLDYFTLGSGATHDELRKWDAQYWMRLAGGSMNYDQGGYCITHSGRSNFASLGEYNCVRPAFIMNPLTLMLSTPDTSGAYSLVNP